MADRDRLAGIRHSGLRYQRLQVSLPSELYKFLDLI